MQVEIYPDPAAFCRGEPYQQWRNRWQPPAQVDLWVDHEPIWQELTPRCAGLTRMVWLDGPRDAAMDGNVWLWLEA